MELFLIRHGQSTNNALTDWTQRVEDPLLTTSGEQQAHHTALHVAAGLHLHPTARDAARPVLDQLYCSPMIRAMQTADAIARVVGLAPEVWLEIHEVGGIYLDHGDRKVGYPGRTRSELARRFPQCILTPELTERGWWNRDFEEAHVGHDRAANVARTLRERAATDARVGLVSHGDFLNALLKALGGQPADAGIYYEHRNTGITCVDLSPQGGRVRYLNRVDHLPEELDTY
jgi:broad specificity phosphatase PhoE